MIQRTREHRICGFPNFALLQVYYWEKIQGSGIVVPYAAHELASNRDQLRVLREHTSSGAF